ncbi:pseudouridine synthase [Flexithrix dorotheae]|uniref:pseudouridine synthase n=1 Tax=Flexithrix dorotheae TaxID=70993 RepID=UPI000369B8BB|nr:pseudouridine synthase [Flexithrix dorotheae]
MKPGRNNSRNNKRNSFKKNEDKGFPKGKKKGVFKKENSEEKATKFTRRQRNTPVTAPTYSEKVFKKEKTAKSDAPALFRLNRFIANAGVCSRREADQLIANGEIKVNGEVKQEMGYKVQPGDKVSYKGKLLRREKLVYLLLNKPKGFITTMEDTHGRKTVMDLVSKACEERIYPVGRLDRDTTGLLLFTNDGEFAKKLAHPSGKTQKIYHVELNRAISEEDFDTIVHKKFELEDGPVDLDGINILHNDRKKLGVELHSGRNRIVRRMFEHFGYEVVKLDRTVFAGLTKIDLPRGKWRFLSEKELIKLKHFQK